MNFIKSITKQIYWYLHKHWIKAHFQKFKPFNKHPFCDHSHKHPYGYLHKHWVKAHFQKFKSFNKHLSYNDVVKLSAVVPGAYKFFATYCDDKLFRRLLEMGFVPNEEVIVISKSDKKGSVVVKVKGSKIALNHRVADKILLKRKYYGNHKAYPSCYSR
ncbi:MAG: ferrous iron transport protein A [Endomicrobium sp.]|jgi:Fe2+ transport system protein FeoA|nr:ferrous iron transport protein A [Endomicrobium sp.]